MNKPVTILHLPRVADPKQASAMVGDWVPDRTPTITGPTLVYDADTAALVAAYLPITDTAPVRRALLGDVSYSQMSRSRNYASRSRTFGYQPRRVVLGREGCTGSGLTRDLPEVEALLEQLADQCARTMIDFAPDIVAEDRATLETVLPDWKIGEEKLWTSGVINDTAQLPYHRDNFNFPAWSAMPVLRRGTRGGHLHLPEYDLVIPCADSTATYFKGKELVHGVTPIERKQENGYRYSIVFYALRGMKDCFTHALETQYGRRRRSERERDMAKRLAAGDTSLPGYKAPTSSAEQADADKEATS